MMEKALSSLQKRKGNPVGVNGHTWTHGIPNSLDTYVMLRCERARVILLVMYNASTRGLAKEMGQIQPEVCWRERSPRSFALLMPPPVQPGPLQNWNFVPLYHRVSVHKVGDRNRCSVERETHCRGVQYPQPAAASTAARGFGLTGSCVQVPNINGA